MTIMARVEKDTMYWDEAMKQPDAPKFFDAAVKEVESHNKNKNWKIISIEEVPKGTKVLDYVWSMKRKRRLLTNEIYKHKARLNIHGGQQQYGINFWDTFAPVVRWATNYHTGINVWMGDSANRFHHSVHTGRCRM
jgi:hypothetical protein